MWNKDFANLIPHSGSMSLIDELLDWDSNHLICQTQSHKSPDNPLRGVGSLHSVHAVEYAGQACALHAGLITKASGRAPKPGILVGIKDAEFHVERLDDLAEALTISVQRVFGDADNAIYVYRLETESRRIASGRLSVMSRPQEQP